jgi:hypothetical protein
VEILPESLALQLMPLVEQGRKFREAILEVLAINLQLLRLWRVEQSARQRVEQKKHKKKKIKSSQKNNPGENPKTPKKVRPKPRT